MVHLLFLSPERRLRVLTVGLWASVALYALMVAVVEPAHTLGNALTDGDRTGHLVQHNGDQEADAGLSKVPVFFTQTTL